MQSENSVKPGLRLFTPGTPTRNKIRGLLWLTAFSLVALFEAFYWIWGNKVEPIVLGLPFGMFLVVVGIVTAFVLGVILFLQDESEAQPGGAQE